MEYHNPRILWNCTKLSNGNYYKVGCTILHVPIKSYEQIIDAHCNCGNIAKSNDHTNKYCIHFVIFLKHLLDKSNKSTPLFPYDPLLIIDETYVFNLFVHIKLDLLICKIIAMI